MSPEEIRVTVQSAMEESVRFPWWSFILAAGFSALGAYLGSYLKRKAEDRAAQENFESLRSQLQQTTRDTEEIKTSLSRKNWFTQQQWAVREQHYMSLLSHLTKLRLSLEDRASYFEQPGSEHDQSIPSGAGFSRLTQVGYESYQAIRELIGPASVFLSRDAIDSLEQLVRDHWDVAGFSSCTEEYVRKSHRLVELAQAAVLLEARAELTAPGL
jgi:hypothetical protein